MAREQRGSRSRRLLPCHEVYCAVCHVSQEDQLSLLHFPSPNDSCFAHVFQRLRVVCRTLSQPQDFPSCSWRVFYSKGPGVFQVWNVISLAELISPLLGLTCRELSLAKNQPQWFHLTRPGHRHDFGTLGLPDLLYFGQYCQLKNCFPSVLISIHGPQHSPLSHRRALC